MFDKTLFDCTLTLVMHKDTYWVDMSGSATWGFWSPLSCRLDLSFPPGPPCCWACISCSNLTVWSEEYWSIVMDCRSCLQLHRHRTVINQLLFRCQKFYEILDNLFFTHFSWYRPVLLMALVYVKEQLHKSQYSNQQNQRLTSNLQMDWFKCFSWREILKMIWHRSTHQ